MFTSAWSLTLIYLPGHNARRDSILRFDDSGDFSWVVHVGIDEVKGDVLRLLLQRVPNDSQDGIDIIRYIVIPKTQDTIAFGFQISSSFLIVFFLFKVLTAIQFHDEFSARRAKIHDIVADGVLRSKLDTAHPMRS